MTDLNSAIGSMFNGYAQLSERRPGIMQLHAPIYHEDGDMLDIYLEKLNGESVRVSDFGMTLMRLSYSFDIDTENKRRIFNQILSENSIECDNGHLSLETTIDKIGPAVLHFAQVVGKVSCLDVLRREIVSGLFFEMVTEFVREELVRFSPDHKVCPLPNRDDLEVDFAFNIRPHPVYLFAVRSNSQARLASISCLEFQRASLPFKGFVVHDDFNALSANDRARITSASDKQFVSFGDFKANAVQFLEREMNDGVANRSVGQRL